MSHLALENAETALENVHDRVVQALPVVDYIVVVNSGNDEGWRVVFAVFLDALFLLLGLVPAAGTSFGFLVLHSLAQELNVAGGEEVEATVNIDNPLAGLGTLSSDESLVFSCFLDLVVDLGAAGSSPGPDLGTGLQTALICRVVGDSLQKICGGCLALFGAS